METYAIIGAGGKQHKVSPQQTIKVERLGVPAGSPVEIDEVFFINDGSDMLIGDPIVKGARVMATSQGEAKGDKVIIFKYKNKTRYQRKTGHRQIYTVLTIDKILKPGGESGA
jgi:large subunit ribosomal protein L21